MSRISGRPTSTDGGTIQQSGRGKVTVVQALVADTKDLGLRALQPQLGRDTVSFCEKLKNLSPQIAKLRVFRLIPRYLVKNNILSNIGLNQSFPAHYFCLVHVTRLQVRRPSRKSSPL